MTVPTNDGLSLFFIVTVSLRPDCLIKSLLFHLLISPPPHKLLLWKITGAGAEFFVSQFWAWPWGCSGHSDKEGSQNCSLDPKILSCSGSQAVAVHEVPCCKRQLEALVWDWPLCLTMGPSSSGPLCGQRQIQFQPWENTEQGEIQIGSRKIASSHKKDYSITKSVKVMAWRHLIEFDLISCNKIKLIVTGH